MGGPAVGHCRPFHHFILFPHALGNAKGNSRTTKDGYIANKVPKVLYLAYLVPAKQTFEALNNIAEIYARREIEDVAFKWESALDLRFIDLTMALS